MAPPASPVLGPLRSSCCHDSPVHPSSPPLWPCTAQTCSQRYFEEAKIRKLGGEAVDSLTSMLAEKDFFLFRSPRRTKGPPASLASRHLPFMTSSLRDRLGTWANICYVLLLLLQRRHGVDLSPSSVFHVDNQNGRGWGVRKQEAGGKKNPKKKRQVKVILHLRSHLNVSEIGGGLLLLITLVCTVASCSSVKPLCPRTSNESLSITQRSDWSY